MSGQSLSRKTPEKMKAIVRTRYGPPEVLQLKEVPKPTPKDDEVLIRIHATTVNRTDCGFLRGKPYFVRFVSGLLRPKRTILGSEFAGEIEAVGKDVKSIVNGDRVFGFSGVRFGAHAEYMAMPEQSMLTTMPANLSYEEAAPSTEGGHYALNNIRRAGVRRGQRVLIYGATGAIGSAAVQLVKHYGAEVTAVCSTRNAELVKSLGADRVIDYTKEDFTKVARSTILSLMQSARVHLAPARNCSNQAGPTVQPNSVSYTRTYSLHCGPQDSRARRSFFQSQKTVRKTLSSSRS
jgi:NADPH:quinone reductase-like Zn-dependent oxidoreductase